MAGGRDFESRAFTAGIGGPVGSGKTALVKALCERLRSGCELGVVTNDIFTREDADFLVRHDALPGDRIIGVETGGCPHAAIREDIGLNLDAHETLMERCRPDLLLLEAAATISPRTSAGSSSDYAIYVIDVSGGDKIPRKGGPGITQSDLLVVNKIDLAGFVGADLEVMARDARKMRGEGPTVFACIADGTGVDAVIAHLMGAREQAAGVLL